MVANLENDSLGDAHDLRTKAGAVKAFPSLLSQLYPVQSWYHGSPLEYRNPNLEAFASYCPMRFRTQRFKSIALYIYMNAIFNAFDLSNVQEMRFHLAQPVANAYEATKLFLAALKDKGYDLSKNLFLLLGEEALEHQTRAIIEAGSHYIILVNNLLGYKRKPTVQQLRSKNIVGCQYVFSSLEELAPYTTLPLTDMASITHRANFVVTSLDVAADDNATKIICTLDETYIFSKLAREAEEIQKLILQNKEHLLNLIASRQAQALGLHLVKQAFDEFVLSKLQEPAEFELVKAVLQERSK